MLMRTSSRRSSSGFALQSCACISCRQHRCPPLQKTQGWGSHGWFYRRRKPKSEGGPPACCKDCRRPRRIQPPRIFFPKTHPEQTATEWVAMERGATVGAALGGGTQSAPRVISRHSWLGRESHCRRRTRPQPAFDSSRRSFFRLADGPAHSILPNSRGCAHGAIVMKN